jgi:biopolymer transport protein ExbD
MSRSNRRQRNKEAKLNITSLLDVFTIMLLFLLVNFAPKEEDVKLHPGIRLPSSTAEIAAYNAIDVILTEKRLIIEDKEVVRLVKGKFPKSVMDDDTIQPYYDELKKIKRKNDRITKINKRKGISKRNIVLFQAEKDISFKLIDKVMMTTAQAGFMNFKFAVLKKQN